VITNLLTLFYYVGIISCSFSEGGFIVIFLFFSPERETKLPRGICFTFEVGFKVLTYYLVPSLVVYLVPSRVVDCC